MNASFLTTEQAVDRAFYLIYGISLFFFLLITVTMVWFVIRYRRSRSPHPTSQADGNIWLEILWTVIPSILVLVMFYYGWAGYLALRKVPENALEVTATASMWSWSFTYANGKTSTKLYVPVARPVLVNLVSLDVLHGFYIPAFRVKRDVVPGMNNQVWFVASRKGVYDLFCSVYCGLDHAKMISTVEVVDEKEFTEWLNRTDSSPVEKSGRQLLEDLGCLGCHSLDGSTLVGPTFKGLWGRKQTVVSSGAEINIIVDEPYLKRSIREPLVEIVKGYPPIMPSNPAITDEEVEEIVEFLKGEEVSK